MSNELEEFKSKHQWIDEEGDDVERLWRLVWNVYTSHFKVEVTERQFTSIMCGVRCKIDGENTTIPASSRRGKLMSHIRQISERLKKKMEEVCKCKPLLARTNRTNKYPDEFMNKYGNDEIVKYLTEKELYTWVENWNWNPIGYRVEVPDPIPEKKPRKRRQKKAVK